MKAPPARLPTGRAALLTEASAAFADLGTFLPLVIGMLVLGSFDATAVLLGFGVFALATGALYGRPIPAQPMKAVAALAITGSLGAEATMATGLMVGIILVGLALSGSMSWLQRLVPRTVLFGIQIGLALSLVASAIGMPGTQVSWSLACLAALAALLMTPLRAVACGLLLVAGIALTLLVGDANLPALTFALHLPTLALPDPAPFLEPSKTALAPQLAMTLTNAVLLTAAISGDYYPQDRERISPRNLALTSGGLNLLLAPFGAVPMCHGAGGLAAYHAQGARTGLAPMVFGSTCIVLALVAGPQALACLELVPGEMLAAFLVLAAVQLANLAKLSGLRPACLSIIAATAVASFVIGVGAGLLVGLALELGRNQLARLRQPSH